MAALAQPDPVVFDAERVRADFPIFRREVHGKPFVFLDTGASAQKPEIVVEQTRRLMQDDYATVHRGVYHLSQQMTAAYEDARAKVARFLGASTAKEVVFVRGATEGINLVANSYGNQAVGEGDEILISAMEHHSNIVPWQLLAERTGAKLKIIPIFDDGTLDWEAFGELLSPKTKIVSLVHVSNAIGTVVDIMRAAEMAHAVGAVLVVDGCQAAPRMRIDVQALGADFYVFSGHKTYGPTGIGVLWGRTELLEAMPPWEGGGAMIEEVTFAKTTYAPPPLRFEAGTPNFVGAVALGTALDYLSALDLDAVDSHERALVAELESALRGLNSIRVVGTAPDKTGVVSFVMEGVHPHDIGTILDRDGIAIRAGHHCTQPLMDRFAVPATARASFGIYNTSADIERLVAGLQKVTDIFG
ncbi:MAG: cysteine desulfurase [Pseudomonadota bacterium]